MTIPSDDTFEEAALDVGTKAGSDARAELARAGLTSLAVHRWLYGFIAGFTKSTCTSLESKQQLGEANPSESATVPNELITARVVRSASASAPLGERYRVVTLDTDGMSVPFAPGDELRILPSNSPEAVRELLRLLAIHPQSKVVVRGREMPAWQAFLESVRIDNATVALCDLMGRFARSPGEVEALESVADQIRSRPKSLMGLLRRFPSIRPPVSATLESLAPITGSLVPIASPPEEASRLTFLAREGDQGYGTLTEGLLARCHDGAWLSFCVHRVGATFAEMDPLAPLIVVCDDLGAAVARSVLLRRQHRSHAGRNWLIGVGGLGSRHPLLTEAADWQESLVCRRVDFLADDEGRWAAQMPGIEEPLWRWLVDKSTLLLAIADSATASELQAALERLLMQRARMTEAAAKERLASWVASEQLVYGLEPHRRRDSDRHQARSSRQQ